MYSKLKRQADKKFGKADSRPQDEDKSLIIAARHTNLGIEPVPPNNYMELLSDSITDLKLNGNDILMCFEVEPGQKTKRKLEWVESQEHLITMTTDVEGCSVIAVDFEFHQSDSYDGFICVASLATKSTTYVIDCLYQSREDSMAFLIPLLSSKPDILKVFCGMDSDVFRMQKDWNCFVTAVVDLQDLFVIWKTQNPEGCLTACKNSAKKYLAQKKRQSDDRAVKEFLHLYNKPSLGFLMETFVKNVAFKNHVATHADFGKRPLHPELVMYAADDATFTLQVFKELASLVGPSGMKQAMEMCKPKLLNKSRLPKYKLLHPIPSGFFGSQCLKWREYLAKNLDKNPEDLLSSTALRDIIVQISDATNLETLSALLQKYGLKDQIIPAARLLLAYIDPDGKELSKMANLVCHRCNIKGHTAKFCFCVMTKDQEREAKRCFRERETQKEKNKQQYNRRWINYCKKRNLDPLTAKKPWE